MREITWIRYIFCLLLPIYCFGFDNTPVVRLGIEHGLSNNAVTSIYQDHNGFMWFGTYDGLNRYDGYGFKVFRNVISDASSLRDNHVSVIRGDANHHIWVGCEKGLSVFNPAKASFYTPGFKPWNAGKVTVLDDGVRSIQIFKSDGTMLVGTQREGLVVFAKNDPVGFQIPFVIAAKQETTYGITAIAVNEKSQTAWIFIPEAGLCEYNLSTKKLSLRSTAIKIADCLLLDSQGNLWLGNEDGLFKYNHQASTFSANKLALRCKVVNLLEDSQGRIWISSDGGGVWTMMIGNESPKPLLSDAGVPIINSNAVYSVYEDNEGGKWIGTLRGGVNVIQKRAPSFQHIVYNPLSAHSNPVDNFILSFCEDEKQNIWIGTDGAGLRYWDRKRNTFTNFVNNNRSPGSISSNFVTSILRDSKGDTWFATWFGGMNRLKRGSRTFENIIIVNPQTGSTENNAWLVFEDRKKRLWVSTTNDGTLYLFNREENRFELFDNNLTNIQALAEDKHGNLWAGNYTSLIQLDQTSKQHKVFKVGYTVRHIYEDSQNNFWIGTDGGGLLLFNRSSGKFQQFTSNEGLPSNAILRILEDNQKNLWLSTYNGLSRFNVLTKKCSNYSLSDGLQSNQFSFNAALALRSGEIVFGGIKGFNIFYPDSVYEKQGHPRSFLTGLRVNNKPIEEQESFVTDRTSGKLEKITLPYNDAMLSLDYVALEFNSTDKVKYAYQLAGWDQSWNYVNNTRTAHYSRLEEGTYTFKIKVRNAAGIWGEEVTLLTVIVLPPWYRTWWAYIIYTLLIASIVYWYIKYKTRQARLKYEVKLAHLEAEKEKELNEKKMNFFTDVSHEFRTPLTLIINPLKEHLNKQGKEGPRDLHIVYRNARRLLSLVDQLLLFQKADTERESLKMTHLNFHQLCKDVFTSFEFGAKSKKITYEFLARDEDLQLSVDREKMEIVLYNLLSNALKYTPEGGQIVFQLTDGSGNVQIDITDSGHGIPAEIGDSLFQRFYQVQKTKTQSKPGFGIGLYLVKHFVEMHGGNVSYKSQPGRGTTFTLSLQKSATQPDNEILMEGVQESSLFSELLQEEESISSGKVELSDFVHNRHSILVIEDENDIRHYVTRIFKPDYTVYEAGSGEQGLRLAKEFLPDIIISDVMMQNGTGIELCHSIKTDPVLSHIPVILLTAVSSSDVKLKGIEGGADDYITKPFERDFLVARVNNLLKNKTVLQQYFYNEVTLQHNTGRISKEYKEFLDTCITIVESHLEDDDFTVKKLTHEIGMSHSNLYRKVKAISGQSVSAFIRFLRLRKAAELMLKSNMNVSEASFQVGISDVKYFRKQFQKLFGMNPSDYIKKYRRSFGDEYTIQKSQVNP